MSSATGALPKSAARRLQGYIRHTATGSLGFVMAILAAMAVGSLIMLWFGHNPLYVYGLLIQGAIGTERSIFISIQRATPLIFTALASMLAFRTGVFNVGVEGQFFIGAIVGTWVGYAFQLPMILHVPAALAAGFLGGAAWAYFPTIMRQRLGVNEIITTIMTNYIATFLISYLTNYPMRATPVTPQTPDVQPTARLAQFVELPLGVGRGSQAHLGIFIALILAAIMYYIFKRTHIGYEWRMVGLSFPFSQFGGISTNRTFITGMLVSGGIAGMGGVIEILGVWRTYKDLFAMGFGFRGNLAALLGQNTVVGSTVAALFYGGMEAGALAMDWGAGVPRQLIDIVVGLIIFFTAATGMWSFLRRIRWVQADQPVRRTTAESEA